MPEAMKPPCKLNEIFLRCWVSYTSVLWKSSVPAAFYADVAMGGAEKATKNRCHLRLEVPKWPTRAVKS
jgi:hypothetical protein